MARLDDITTLPTNLELAGNDSLVIADKSFNGGTFAKQIPAAIIAKYSHAFLFNFNSASVFIDDRFATPHLISFDGNQIIDNAAVIVTEPFAGNLGSDPAIDLGLHPSDNVDASGNQDLIPDNLVNRLSINALGAATFNQGTNEATDAILCPNGNHLRATFDANSNKKLHHATAGQVVILVNIIDVNDYKDLVPAFD